MSMLVFYKGLKTGFQMKEGRGNDLSGGSDRRKSEGNGSDRK